MNWRAEARPDSADIVLLADHPEAISVIAAGYVAEWDFWYGSGGRGDARADLLERSQADALPLGLAAKRVQEYVGAVAIAENAISVAPELTPCLIGLWVAPEHRKCGIGTALLRAAIVKAAALGFERVYGSTSVVPELFARNGWTEIVKTNFNDEKLSIFAIDCEKSN